MQKIDICMGVRIQDYPNLMLGNSIQSFLFSVISLLIFSNTSAQQASYF
jgi:hypothetical protein